MNTEERIKKLENQVKVMQDYILGMTGNLNYKDTVGKFAKEAVVQQSVAIGTPPASIINAIGMSGGDTFAFPDDFIFIVDKANKVWKVPAYDTII